MKNLKLILTAAMMLPAAFVYGQTVMLTPTQDAGYFAAGFVDGVPQVSDRNFGAHNFVPVAHANNDRVNRALFQFDIAGNVPAGSTIDAATFSFEVTQQGGPQGQTALDFNLHRVTTAWDEGTGAGMQGAISGDGATWAMATATVAWNTFGGDFDSAISGAVTVNGAGMYDLSGANLVTDIQNIVDGSTTDYGFLLKGASEVLSLIHI